MKINSKPTSLILAITAMIVCSCSTNSDSQPDPTPEFFNLNVGNEWVYKEYSRQFDSLPYEFNGKIDSVKVESTVNIEGLTFSKLRHKIGNSVKYEFLRVDELGHLVGNNLLLIDVPLTAEGLKSVKHPGNDTAYENTLVKETGTTFSSVFPNQDIVVEGNSYIVSPFVFQYTSPAGETPIIHKSVSTDYQRQVGLVRKSDGYASGRLSWENRLVWYHLAQ